MGLWLPASAGSRRRADGGFVVSNQNMVPVLALSSVLIALTQDPPKAKPPDCPDHNVVEYSVPAPEYPASIRVEMSAAPTGGGVRGVPHRSPHGTASYRMREAPAGGSTPAATIVEVLGNKGRPLHVVITIADYMKAPTVRWVNEKLLWLQVWRGRIVSTDAILDVETGRLMYREDANYNSILVPCDMKPSPRGTSQAAEIASLASPRCDAWFETGGTFASSGDDLSFTLQNRSADPSCRVDAVTLTFRVPMARSQIRVTTPTGWTATPIACSGSAFVCGIVWRATVALPPRESLGGFGLSSPTQALLQS
ncbi:MAG TPA: hypothetical protein VF147_11215, partial [Vicinamibacterales bacterium]